MVGIFVIVIFLKMKKAYNSKLNEFLFGFFFICQIRSQVHDDFLKYGFCFAVENPVRRTSSLNLVP